MTAPSGPSAHSPPEKGAARLQAGWWTPLLLLQLLLLLLQPLLLRHAAAACQLLPGCGLLIFRRLTAVCSPRCSCLVPVGPMMGQVNPPGSCLLSGATAGDRQTRIAYSFMQVRLARDESLLGR